MKEKRENSFIEQLKDNCEYEVVKSNGPRAVVIHIALMMDTEISKTGPWCSCVMSALQAYIHFDGVLKRGLVSVLNIIYMTTNCIPLNNYLLYIDI